MVWRRKCSAEVIVCSGMVCVRRGNKVARKSIDGIWELEMMFFDDVVPSAADPPMHEVPCSLIVA